MTNYDRTEKAAIQRQLETNTELYDKLATDCTLQEKARAVANALFATGHNEYLSREAMLSNMCLLSGTAVAILYDCIRALDGGGKNEGRE